MCAWWHREFTAENTLARRRAFVCVGYARKLMQRHAVSAL
jgi:hypothetical protein